MALLTIPAEDGSMRLENERAIAGYLAEFGIDYEKWKPARPVNADASADEVLLAYAKEIEELKARGNYVTADVIDVTPETPGLEEMLAKFNQEHWHDEDEVRFIISGHGLFHIHPESGPVVAIEVEAGDLIRVPRGTWHWFNLCADRRIRAIRLFQNQSGWTPQYTGSRIDESFVPVCFGLSHLPNETGNDTVTTFDE
ncbi:MAG: 1,2-dihydroxy-3-keto-5-methylthiopentene dioxygenase [Pyrinomonadaceae bacterium]